MSLEPLPWLPAASRADLETVMRFVVERWLADWITGPVGFDIVSSAQPDNVSDDWRGARGAWLQGGLADAAALGLAACDGRADSINPVDRDLLERVGDDMLNDFLVRLGAGPGKNAVPERGYTAPGPNGPDGAKHRFRVAASKGEWSLLLALGESVLVRLRKAMAGSSRTPDIIPLSTALAGEEVRLGCHLGSAGITAADLSTLTAGDVLVFDRHIEASVPLTINGNLPRTGRALIGAQAGAIQVTLTEAIDLLQGI